MTKMEKMKKLLTIAFVALILSGCEKDDFIPDSSVVVNPQLQIKNSVGIKLETSFVSSEVSMNVKTEFGGNVTIKIFDISNRIVSKENVTVKVGDNILKVYTSALPVSAYRIGIYDENNNMLGITDFNKIN
jgi:PBP1b-binding outer membrane lipoprotein LpoB